MGSASSKAARGTARRYPSTPSSATSSRRAKPASSPTTEAAKSDQGPKEHDGGSRPDGMDPDSFDGDFSQRLQKMGIVQPNPTYSPSSTAIPHAPPIASSRSAPVGPSSATSPGAGSTLSALEARRRLQRQAEVELEEMGSGNSQGRRFMDMRTLIDAIRMLDQGMSRTDIETRLNLKKGLLDKLGRPGILSHETTV